MIYVLPSIHAVISWDLLVAYHLCLVRGQTEPNFESFAVTRPAFLSCSSSRMSARRAASFVKAPSAVPKRPATSYRSRPKPDEPPVAVPTTGQINALAAVRAPLPHALRLSDVRVIYADKNLAVISKPSGLISQPDSSASVRPLFQLHVPMTDTVSTYRTGLGLPTKVRLLFIPSYRMLTECKTAVERKLGLPRSTPFYPVHRLDQRTTGCMLLPTSQALSRDIAQQFASRSLEKTYLALVRGGAKSFAKTEGVIEENLVLNDGRARKARKGEEGTGTSTRWELLGSSVRPGAVVRSQANLSP
jgi:23S rRNA-/tRNA-specific pseudouridylate synthase